MNKVAKAALWTALAFGGSYFAINGGGWLGWNIPLAWGMRDGSDHERHSGPGNGHSTGGYGSAGYMSSGGATAVPDSPPEIGNPGDRVLAGGPGGGYDGGGNSPGGFGGSNAGSDSRPPGGVSLTFVNRHSVRLLDI